MPEDALPHQPNEAADQNACRNEKGMPARALALSWRRFRSRTALAAFFLISAHAWSVFF
jgi:hypothetical protein